MIPKKMAKKLKIKPISWLLNELDKPLYEGRWQDVTAMMKKFGKKATIPEAFNHFLKGAEALDSVMLGKSEFTLAEAETRLRRATELCQLGDPGDAALQLLASLKRGQMLWLGGSYEAALRILRENVNCSADTSLLHVCKVLVEGNSCLGLCLDWLSTQQSTSSAASTSTNNLSLSQAAVSAYEDSLRLSLELVYNAKSQSLSQQPATLKAIKTALERGPMLCMSLGMQERALNFYRKVLHQHRSEDVLKEARHYCVLCMASLLTFHASCSSHAIPQLSIPAYSPSQLPEETMLVSFLSKAFVDTWKVSVDTSLSPACVFDLLTLVLSSQNLCGMMVQCLEDSMRFTTHHPHLWLQFSLALAGSGLTKQALAVFHECIDHFSTDPLVLLTGANFALEKADRPDVCVEWATMATGVCRGHFLEAKMEYLLGRGYSVLSEKETSSKKRQELRREGLEHLTAAVRLDRGDVVYAFHLAVQLAESRQLSSSKLEVQRALELNAGHTSCLHLLALVLSAEKLYENALKVCEFALLKQPDNFGLLECKIQLEMMLHGASQSLKTCKHALQLWRKTYSEEVTGLIAIVTQDQRSLSELSLPHEHRDIEVNFNPDVESDAGSSHFSVGGARSQQVNQPSVLQARIWCTVADVYLKDGKMSDATSCVREAQCLAPLLPSVILSYGRILQQEGRLQEACQQYQSALTLQPTSTTALTLMGQCQYCLRKFSEAEKYLREATSSDQLCHEAWYWLGETLREQTYYEMAADCFKTALDLEATAPIQPFSVVVSSLVPAS